MVKAFIVYGFLVCGLMFMANSQGWALWRALSPDNWGSTQNGVYYHGSSFYHK